MNIKSVFISTDLSGNDTLSLFCLERGIELIAKSLIRFEKIEIQLNSKADVIFFSSPRSFEFFEGDLVNKTLACYGKSTYKKIIQLRPDLEKQFQFIGEDTANPKRIANKFKSWLGEKSVLFPISEQSKKSIASEIPFSQKEESIVYKTISAPSKIEHKSVYVFTSPSNLESFLLKNEIPKTAICIAWGKSTSTKMKDLGIKNFEELEESSLESLVGVLNDFSRKER